MTETQLKTQAPQAADALLSVEDLSVRFGSAATGRTVVEGISFSVRRGETLAIVGESGSGKSVTSMAVMRIVESGGGKITGGRIQFAGAQGRIDLALQDEPTMRGLRGSEIAMIFQEPMTSLNPVFTVGAQLSEAILLHQKMSKAGARVAALELLKKVRIPAPESIMSRYPHELSGGMRQRIMIAMALSCRPSLLIADEPTTALDVTIQAQILALIKDLQAELDMGVIIITHDMGVVAEVADRVVVMRHGRKVEEADCAALFAAPQQSYTQQLLAAVPKLGQMRGTRLPAPFLIPGQEAPASGPVRVPSEEKILSVRELTTRFDINGGLLGRAQARVHAVESVDLDLYRGETLAIVGESGSGKTTLGRTILNLAAKTSGRIELHGRSIDYRRAEDRAFARQGFQMVFQDPYSSLNPRQRIGDSIREPLDIDGRVTRAEADARVDDLLKRVGLDASARDRFPHEFSGGQRQRICIARAIAPNPNIVIADEAVSALDVSVQAEIVNLMMDLQRDLGISYIFISHDMAVVERVSHRVAVMYCGQLVELGPRHSVFENPQHSYTRKLLDAVPIADPTARRQRSLELSELPSPVKKVGYVPQLNRLREISDGHFVAQ